MQNGLKKLNLELPKDTEIPFWEVCPKEEGRGSNGYLHTNIQGEGEARQMPFDRRRDKPEEAQTRTRIRLSLEREGLSDTC